MNPEIYLKVMEDYSKKYKESLRIFKEEKGLFFEDFVITQLASIAAALDVHSNPEKYLDDDDVFTGLFKRNQKEKEE
jgi:hypothetical protein